jgi:hypothetical protein
MIIELRLKVRVGQHLMDGFFHIPRSPVQPDADPFLDLNDGETEHNPNENQANGNFDNGAQVHGVLLDMKMN